MNADSVAVRLTIASRLLRERGYAARPGESFRAGSGGTLESSMLKPSAIVG
jgi:hypothetical protein